MNWDGSPEKPVYAKLREHDGSNLFMITVNEGWRMQVLCGGMYEWAADFLLGQLQGKPLPEVRV